MVKKKKWYQRIQIRMNPHVILFWIRCYLFNSNGLNIYINLKNKWYKLILKTSGLKNKSNIIREGLKKEINYFHGIFHGGVPPPLPLRWKIINFVPTIFQFFRRHLHHTKCVSGQLDHKTKKMKNYWTRLIIFHGRGGTPPCKIPWFWFCLTLPLDINLNIY